MIIGERPTVMDAFRNTKLYTFYLTGSKFFGGSTSKSDTDFFTEYSVSVINFLLTLSFQLEECDGLNHVSYTDSNCIVVYVNQERTIHVQLVRDVERKQNAQTFLTDFPFQFLEKGQRRHVWDWAMRITQY